MHLFLGHLCHSLQREIPPHRCPGRLERDPTRTWGGEDHQTTWGWPPHTLCIAQGAPCTAIREVSLLKDLKHANIGEQDVSKSATWTEVKLQKIKEGGAGWGYFTGWRLWGVFNHLLMDHHHPPRGAPLACNHLVCGLQHLFGVDKRGKIILCNCGDPVRSEMTLKYQESARSSTSELRVPWSKYKIRSHVQHWRMLQNFSTILILLSCSLPPVLLRVVNCLLITNSKYAFTF